MADGGEYNVLQSKESGGPVEVVYPTEGTPLVVGPNGIFKNAPNPNAARLFQCYCFTPECQQLIVDFGALRSMHPLIKEKTGRKPFRDIKTMKEDPAGVEQASEQIKARYSRLFGV
jgi:iron(III) transport system substrate-binding protein